MVIRFMPIKGWFYRTPSAPHQSSAGIPCDYPTIASSCQNPRSGKTRRFPPLGNRKPGTDSVTWTRKNSFFCVHFSATSFSIPGRDSFSTSSGGNYVFEKQGGCQQILAQDEATYLFREAPT